MRIGSHVERGSISKGALLRESEVAQINTSAPQTWRKPSEKGDEESLKMGNLVIYVHAPYLVNPSSLNADVREKSVICLQEQINYANKIGAKGLVVHGGHPTGSGVYDDGLRNWLDVLSRLEFGGMRLIVENTAGGKEAVARKLHNIENFFSKVRSTGYDIGFCLDTCHSWAGGIDQKNMVRNLKDAVGEIDLLHLNNSKDDFNSSRDRHENILIGKINPEYLLEVIVEADTDTVVETPGGELAQREDVRYIRAELNKPFLNM